MRSLAFTLLTSVLVLLAEGAAADVKNDSGLQLKALPPAVQKAVQDNLQGSQIKHIAKEKEHGVVQYEVETNLNGKGRDLVVDAKGNLVVVEVETSIDKIPAGAKAAILKKVGGGKLGLVETFTKTGQPEMYEAAYTDLKGKKHEVLVKADGTETKE